MAGRLSEYENILLDLTDHKDILDTILYHLQKDQKIAEKDKTTS